ncbi:MAG: acyl transferase [Chitinophagaceae bacterium]
MSLNKFTVFDNIKVTMPEQWNHKIFGIEKGGFEQLSLQIFRFQFVNNAIYRAYVQALAINPDFVSSVEQIPFLPVSFFKTHDIKTTDFKPAVIFESSGTTATGNSRHLVKDLILYEESFLGCFQQFYGKVNEWCIIGLLPSYLQKGNSSLVYMVNQLISDSGHAQSGFYLDEFEKLYTVLQKQEEKKQKTLLIGVTFALLDFAEKYAVQLNHTTILETGGMKGRRREMIRSEVHSILQDSFGQANIHSEYGMTELLSQAYSKAGGVFNCPPWMKVLIREEEDPLLIKKQGTGLINVIDIANVYSCSFIATDDIGKLYPNGSFEVLGRRDGSDLRGCSLMLV